MMLNHRHLDTTSIGGSVKGEKKSKRNRMILENTMKKLNIDVDKASCEYRVPLPTKSNRGIFNILVIELELLG